MSPDVVQPGAWRPPFAVRLSVGLHGTVVGMLALNPAWWPEGAAAIAGNHLALAAAGLWPRGQWLGPNTHRVDAPSRTVALTFDDGPDPAVTPRVLDLLGAAGAHASFFCIGREARRYPALVRRIVAEGHWVENHTDTHPNSFALLAGPALRREVAAAQETLAALSGTPPAWFRAPMGIRSPLLDPVLHGAGLRLASWTRRGFDTRCRNPATILARLAQRGAAGDILLLHDGNGAKTVSGAPVVLEVLPALLAHLHGCGLTAEPLPRPDAATAGQSPTPAECASTSAMRCPAHSGNG